MFGGECYQTPIFHVHTGSITEGTGCYTQPLYHTHEYNGDLILAQNDANTQYKIISTNTTYNGYVATESGGCYTVPISKYHFHTDACYENYELVCGLSETHIHTAKDVENGCWEWFYKRHSHVNTETTVYSLTSPGECYSPNGHTHNAVGRCASHTTETRHYYEFQWVEEYTSPTTRKTYYECTYADCGQTSSTPTGHWHNIPTTVYDCDTSVVNTWKFTCSKTEGVRYEDEGVDYYNLVCGHEQSVGDIQYFYGLDCSTQEGEIVGYELSCNKSTTDACDADSWSLSCIKSDDGGAYEGQSCDYAGGAGYYGGAIGDPIYHVHKGDGRSTGGCWKAYTASGTRQVPCWYFTDIQCTYNASCSCGGCWTTTGRWVEGTKTETYYYTSYKTICGKTEGVSIDDYHGGYGGSNYCTPDGDIIEQKEGVQEGCGFLKITTVYGIEYNLNKGEFPNDYPKYIWYGEDGIVDNPVRAGYTFQGWDIEGMEPTPIIGGVEYHGTSATRIKDTLFKNLRFTPGWVKFTAIWKDETPPDIDDIVYKNTSTTKYGGEVYNTIEYTPGTWTGQTVTATVTTHDAGSGINSLRWTGKMFTNTDQTSVSDDTDDWILNNTEDVNNFTNTKTFTETGVYKGIIYVRDNADTENEDHISNGVKNQSEIEYGEIWIDKDKPTGLIEYGYCTDPDFSVDKWTYASDGSYLNESQIGQWNTSGALPTNKNVVVRITAQDTHSGVHDISAYSWDSESDWTNKNTKIFDECTEGYVLVRDNVGNVERFDYKVSNIDKKDPFVYPDKKPKDDDVSGEPLPKDDDETEYQYGNDTDYTFQHLDNLLTYDWVNYNLNLVFHSKEEPQEAPDKEYSTSGIARMELFQTDSSFAEESKSSVEKVLKKETLSYTVETQGITYYVLEIEDEATNLTSVKLTVKVDKTAPVIPNGLNGNDGAYRFYIEDIDLNKYGIQVQGNGKTEVENKIQDMSAMKRSFLFVGSDYNNEDHGDITNSEDSSGICQFIIKLINADDETDYKEYKLTDGDNYTFGNYGNETRVGFLTGPVSEFNYEPVSNTYEFASLSTIKVPLKGTFGIELNTFKDFPNAAALKYQITIVDRAGNQTVYNSDAGNEIRNFSIKAVIHYAGVLDEDSNLLSDSANVELNVQQEDPSNGKLTNIPYFKSGEFGYVEVWTIGYVPEIGFDFGNDDVYSASSENMGKESKDEIKAGYMRSLYNLGISSDNDDLQSFVRTISYTQGEAISTSLADNNGVPFATHYGGSESLAIANSSFRDFAGRFKESGTAIRIPVYYGLTPDGTTKSDGSDNYAWEVHQADIIAYINKPSKTYREISNPLYVIWDTKIPDAHYRITHES